MDIKNPIFVEKERQLPWDETSLKAFKKSIRDNGMKCRMDDIFLLGFLRAKNFDLKSSLEMLKNYYNTRVNYPQYFKDLLPSKLEHALSMNSVQFLPQPDQNGRFILIWQYKDWDTSVCNVYDMYRAIFLHTDLQLNYHRTQEKGIVFILNAERLSFSHFLQFSPRVMNSIAHILLKGSYQLPYKEIHYVNMNLMYKAILSVFVPLVPNELKKILHFHTDMSTLHEYVSPECLPLEYGGKLPNFDTTQSNNMIRANEEFFRMNDEYLKLYEEEINRNLTHGKYRYVSEDVDEKLKKFIEKCEDKFKRYSQDPEVYLASLKQEPECQSRHY